MMSDLMLQPSQYAQDMPTEMGGHALYYGLSRHDDSASELRARTELAEVVRHERC